MLGQDELFNEKVENSTKDEDNCGSSLKYQEESSNIPKNTIQILEKPEIFLPNNLKNNLTNPENHFPFSMPKINPVIVRVSYPKHQQLIKNEDKLSQTTSKDSDKENKLQYLQREPSLGTPPSRIDPLRWHKRLYRQVAIQKWRQKKKTKKFWQKATKICR